MTACRSSRHGAGVFALFLLVTPALSQVGTSSPETQPNNYPPALPARRGPGPTLVFERIGEIALPGPLGTEAGFVADGEVFVPVSGGWARVAPDAEAKPSIVPSVDAPPASDWVVAPDGKRRYRTTQEGLVESEHRSKPSKRWSRSWRIIAPNSIMAPPILLGPRLCYTGLDDRVTCVRASNGHRLWAVDLGDRLSKGLTCWPACGAGDVSGEILLVVPDDGATLIALDAYDGRRVTTYDLPPTQRFSSPAFVAGSETIAVARKGYDEKEAALVLLRLTPPPAEPSPPLPYNDRPPSRPDPEGG